MEDSGLSIQAAPQTPPVLSFYRCRNGHVTPARVLVTVDEINYHLCARCYADWILSHIPESYELTPEEASEWQKRKQSRR